MHSHLRERNKIAKQKRLLAKLILGKEAFSRFYLLFLLPR